MASKTSYRQCAFLLFILASIIPPVLSTFDVHIASRESYARSPFQRRDNEDESTCTKKKGCPKGCCGPLDPATGKGTCGTGPKFCGDGCTSQCNYKSECDPGWGMKWSNMSKCPLNVCCSEYGFCGTTDQFCGGKKVISPSCDPAAGSSNNRTIGYYEGWNYQHACGTMTPEQVPIGFYTHINFAFSLIDPDTFTLMPMDVGTGALYTRVNGLKERDPDLQVWIAIGGWAMNDPGPTRNVFSNLAKSQPAQDTFFESVVSFITAHGFDGIDIDWEYPVAGDRGGVAADFDNYVTFVQRFRQRLDKVGKPIGLSLTLPASYWYLRGFNIAKLEPHVDWYNIMTYDIHGVWDSTVQSIGAFAYAHTNLTEIQAGLELLWRNNINPSRVNLGLGFYGRSFTMKDPNCMAAGCPFSSAAVGGNCTGTPGVLSAAEIVQIIKDGATVTFDPEAAVKIVTWDKNQWVSWDDTETLKLKVEYANQRCLGGTMVWAIDLDDGTLIDSLGNSLGRPKNLDLGPPLPYAPCFGGSGWPDTPKDEL
ncbi:glycoside hydrolase family 18 protein [Hypoxylon sp. CI-4A]|nr:glycoside hydrolase family 18 protein [Hypoxylon sp. CI-4A]